MDDFKDVNIDGIGRVRFIKNKRSRRLSLRFKYSDELIVTIPHRLSYQIAQDIIMDKYDWVVKKMSKAPELKKLRTIFDVNTTFETKNHRLAIIPDILEKAKVKIYDGIIKVRYPETKDVRSEEIQKVIRAGIEKALKLEAENWIPFRIQKFSKQHGFNYKEIRFKNAKTRWGSCSHNNNLNFNIHLMTLPEDLIDYVILHELCHTIEKNHSHKFWSLMDKILTVCDGGSKDIDKGLKKYRIGVF